MPAKGALAGSLIDTGHKIADAISNIKQLLEEHLDCLKIFDRPQSTRRIVKYDERKVFHYPFISIIHDQTVLTKELIGDCGELTIDIIIHQFLDTLQFGKDTFEFIKALDKLTEIIWVHPDLYNFTKGTARGMTIRSARLIGKVLESDAVFANEVAISVPVRICREHEACT